MRLTFLTLLLTCVFAFPLQAQTSATVAADWTITLPDGTLSPSYSIDISTMGFPKEKAVQLFCSSASDNYFTFIEDYDHNSIIIRPVIHHGTTAWTISDWNNRLHLNRQRFVNAFEKCQNF